MTTDGTIDGTTDGDAATVGMPATLRELVLPGTLLEAKRTDFKTPVIVRVARSWPHGTAFRYDLVWYGLEPGSHDLRDYLQRVDGSSAADLPPIPVTVTSVLPQGQVLPTARPVGEVDGIGGYRALLITGGVLWLLALVALIVFRRRRALVAGRAAGAATITREERLRALVAEAAAGGISSRKRAELELALVEAWRQRLELRGLAPAAAFARLREHPESGPVIRRLEEWLHRPAAAGLVTIGVAVRPPFDVAALLPPESATPAPERESEAAWKR